MQAFWLFPLLLLMSNLTHFPTPKPTLYTKHPLPSRWHPQPSHHLDLKSQRHLCQTIITHLYRDQERLPLDLQWSLKPLSAFNTVLREHVDSASAKAWSHWANSLRKNKSLQVWNLCLMSWNFWPQNMAEMNSYSILWLWVVGFIYPMAAAEGQCHSRFQFMTKRSKTEARLMFPPTHNTCTHTHTHTHTEGCVALNSQIILNSSSSWPGPTITFRSNQRLKYNLRCLIFSVSGDGRSENLLAAFLWDIASGGFLRPQLSKNAGAHAPSLAFQVSRSLCWQRLADLPKIVVSSGIVLMAGWDQLWC